MTNENQTGTYRVKSGMAEMVKGGVWLNLIGIGVITLACSTLLVWVFGLAL